MALLVIIFTQDLFERFLETVMYLQELNNLLSSDATCNFVMNWASTFELPCVYLGIIPAVCILKK